MSAPAATAGFRTLEAERSAGEGAVAGPCRAAISRSRGLFAAFGLPAEYGAGAAGPALAPDPAVTQWAGWAEAGL
jgi:hypothetical protein